MAKRYICFTCYKFHPEMKGVSEEEFLKGNNVCKQERCFRHGQPLEPAHACEICGKLYPRDGKHTHPS